MIKTIVSTVVLPNEKVLKISDPVNFIVGEEFENGEIKYKSILLSKEKYDIIQSIMMRIVNDEIIEFVEHRGVLEGRLSVEVL